MTRITFHAKNDAELVEKMIKFVRALGYRVELETVPMIGLGKLARQLGRATSSVSRSLFRAGCPPFDAERGKTGRIVNIRPDAKLVAFLRKHAR